MPARHAGRVKCKHGAVHESHVRHDVELAESLETQAWLAAAVCMRK